MNTKEQTIILGDISIEVIRKDIKNIHLSVYPPQGKVKISAPLRMDTETIRVFTIAKTAWIRKQQAKFQRQNREAIRECIPRESHYYLGKRYLLKVIEHNGPGKIFLRHSTLDMYVRPNTPIGKKQNLLAEWYRSQIKALVPSYIAAFEKKMNLSISEFRIRKMKTKWGTCNPKAKRIWLNLELAKKPIECLEYIIAHEMVHILERHHNERFTDYMDKYLPQWRQHKAELGRLPLGHVDWEE
jgi:predicted metal-dependent hydrolase